MKITIENTSKIVQLNGLSARIWEGKTESSIPVHCYITRVAVHEDQPPEVFKQFEQELQETKKPTPEIEAIPLKMFID